MTQTKLMLGAGALALLLTACAQDGTQQSASYNETDQGSMETARQAEAVDAMDSDPTGTQYDDELMDDGYVAEAEAEPLPGAYDDPYAEPGADPIGDELAGLEGGPSSDGLSMDEDQVVAQARDDFAMADLDGDGALTEDEYVSTMTPAADPYGAPMGEGDASYDEDMSVMTDADPDAASYLASKFSTVAGDDGELSLDELEESAREDFAAADEDGDDMLTGEETATFTALREGRTASDGF